MTLTEIMEMVNTKQADLAEKQPPAGEGPALAEQLSEAGKELVMMEERAQQTGGKKVEQANFTGEDADDEAMNASQRSVKERIPPKGDVPENPISTTPATMDARKNTTQAPGVKKRQGAGGGGDMDYKMSHDAQAIAQMFHQMAKEAEANDNHGDAQQLAKQAQAYYQIAQRAEQRTKQATNDGNAQQAFQQLVSQGGSKQAQVEEIVNMERSKLAQEYFSAGQVMAQGFLSEVQDAGSFGKQAGDVIPVLQNIRDNQAKIASFIADLAEAVGFDNE